MSTARFLAAALAFAALLALPRPPAAAAPDVDGTYVLKDSRGETCELFVTSWRTRYVIDLMRGGNKKLCYTEGYGTWSGPTLTISRTLPTGEDCTVRVTFTSSRIEVQGDSDCYMPCFDGVYKVVEKK
jgi:hypothetical protein